MLEGGGTTRHTPLRGRSAEPTVRCSSICYMGKTVAMQCRSRSRNRCRWGNPSPNASVWDEWGRAASRFQ